MRRLALPSPTSSLTLIVALSLLSACATRSPRISARQQAARYAAMAPRSYSPPGPAWNPWGPYITQASHRFNIPARWIREVMQVESGGQEYLDGEPITSPAGAMGLMQVMPETYEELQSEYGLGSDPYDPRNNIMAGAAYIREMYDLFGAPGFLAAYNCGPACYQDYLEGRIRLPAETRRYVAMLAPRISGASAGPMSVQYAMNTPPRSFPSSPRSAPVRPQVRLAPLPAPPRQVVAPPPVRVASLPPPPRPPSRFHLIPQAMADTLPPTQSTSIRGHWAIQVGAFDQVSSAHVALNEARQQEPSLLGPAWPMVESVNEPHKILYRARLVGLSRGAAQQACEALEHHKLACFLVSPAAQS